MTNDEALDLLGRLHLAAVEGYEDHGIEERIARVSTDLKTYIEQTASELERVRAGFDAMAAEHATFSNCPVDAEFNAAEATAFGCPVTMDGDCIRNGAECWQRVFIERGTRQ